MKRRIILYTLMLLLLIHLPLAAFAVPVRVHDNAGLMSESEIQQLETLAEEISGETGLDLVILTVDTIGSYTPRNYADDYYDMNGYSDNGIIFMLAMQEREWYISTCGDAFHGLSDKEIDAILDIGLSYFADGAYYEGFNSVLYSVPHFMEENTENIPIANNTPGYRSPENSGTSGIFLISALIGFVVSGVVLLVMRGMMNTKRKQRSAVDYMTQGSYQLRTRQDIFLYSHVSKTPRQQNTSSGRGSAHRSSSGRIHGGGGKKF